MIKAVACSVGGRSINLCLSLFCLGLALIGIRSSAAETNLVQRFKDYLADRPAVENVFFLKRKLYEPLPPGSGFTNREISIFAGRWESEERYFIQGLFDAKQRKEPSREKTVSGQSNEVYYSVLDGRLTLGEKPKTGPMGLPVVALSAKPILDEALNCGCTWVKSGTWRWNGDGFVADVEGGSIAGRLETENGLPKRIVYRGKGTYIRPNQDYIVKYSYEGAPEGSFYPAKYRTSVQVNGSKVEEPRIDYTILEFQLADGPLPAVAFDPQQFIIPRWDTIFYKTKDGVFYRHPARKEPSYVTTLPTVDRHPPRRVRPLFIGLIAAILAAPMGYLLLSRRLRHRPI